MIYIGVDDTDNHESRGTGFLARSIAADLRQDFPVLGVTRHQLSKDERVPCTSNNSSACIYLQAEADEVDLKALTERVKKIMLADFQEGSDPGLCVAHNVPDEIGRFGSSAQTSLVKQQSARDLAAKYGITLLGLGGTNDGVIGALCAVGLGAQGSDGRYVQIGSIRELSGRVPVQAVLDAGVDDVRLMDQTPVRKGLVNADKLRPAKREHQAFLYVVEQEGILEPQKLD